MVVDWWFGVLTVNVIYLCVVFVGFWLLLLIYLSVWFCLFGGWVRVWLFVFFMVVFARVVLLFVLIWRCLVWFSRLLGFVVWLWVLVLYVGFARWWVVVDLIDFAVWVVCQFNCLLFVGWIADLCLCDVFVCVGV